MRQDLFAGPGLLLGKAECPVLIDIKGIVRGDRVLNHAITLFLEPAKSSRRANGTVRTAFRKKNPVRP